MKQKVLSKTNKSQPANHLKLIELEKKLTLFMLNTEDSFVLVGKDFKIVTFNRQFKLLYKKFFGATVIKGESILKYARKNRVETLKTIYRRVFSGKSIESELDIPLPNGSSVSFLLKYKPAYDENRSIIGAFVSSLDITEIKKARLALVQSEEQYRSLVEHAMMAVFLTIPDKIGTILQANKAAVKMFGYSLKEFEAAYMDMLFEKNDPNLAALLKKRNKTGKAKGELTAIRKNKDRFPCEFSSVSFLDMNGNIRNTTTIIDISEQKKTQQELKTKEEHLRVIIDNEPECVCVADRQGYLREINPAGLKMIQARSSKSVIGRKCISFIHPADKKVFNAQHQAVYNGHSKSASFRINGLKNQQLWVESNAVPLKDDDGKVYAVLSVIRDITSRIESDQKIRDSEATLRAIFDNSTEGLMLLDVKGRIRAFNAKAAENHVLHNVRYDLEVGQKLIDYIDKDRKAYFKGLMSKVLGGESLEYDIDYIRKDGGRSWFHAALSPVWEGEVITGICIARSDISERKIAEQQISEAMERYNMVYN
jgi:PAS domain S-box-containing protein